MLIIMLLHACARTHQTETLLYTQPIKQSSQFKTSPVKTEQPLPKKSTDQKKPKQLKQTPQLDREIYHTVSEGETLADIAKRYGYTETEIAASNGIYPPYTINPGETLVIPSRSPIILRGYNYEAIPVVIPPPPKPEQLENQ